MQYDQCNWYGIRFSVGWVNFRLEGTTLEIEKSMWELKEGGCWIYRRNYGEMSEKPIVNRKRFSHLCDPAIG